MPFVLIISTWRWINGDCFPLKFQTPVCTSGRLWTAFSEWSVAKMESQSWEKTTFHPSNILPQASFSLFRCGPWLKSVQSYCGPPLRPQRPHHTALTGVGFSESKRFHLHLPGSVSSPPSAMLYKGNFKIIQFIKDIDIHEDLVFVDSWNCVFDHFVTLDFGLFFSSTESSSDSSSTRILKYTWSHSWCPHHRNFSIYWTSLLQVKGQCWASASRFAL